MSIYKFLGVGGELIGANANEIVPWYERVIKATRGLSDPDLTQQVSNFAESLPGTVASGMMSGPIFAHRFPYHEFAINQGRRAFTSFAPNDVGTHAHTDKFGFPSGFTSVDLPGIRISTHGLRAEPPSDMPDGTGVPTLVSALHNLSEGKLDHEVVGNMVMQLYGDWLSRPLAAGASMNRSFPEQVGRVFGLGGHRNELSYSDLMRSEDATGILFTGDGHISLAKPANAVINGIQFVHHPALALREGQVAREAIYPKTNIEDWRKKVVPEINSSGSIEDRYWRL